jgi:hypothetical protein
MPKQIKHLEYQKFPRGINSGKKQSRGTITIFIEITVQVVLSHRHQKDSSNDTAVKTSRPLAIALR